MLITGISHDNERDYRSVMGNSKDKKASYVTMESNTQHDKINNSTIIRVV